MTRAQKLTILCTMLVVWASMGLYSDNLILPFVLKDVQGAPWGLKTFLFKPGLVLATLALPAAWFGSVGLGAWYLFRWIFRERKAR